MAPSVWRSEPTPFQIAATTTCTSTRRLAFGCRPGTGWTAWTWSSRWSSTTCGWSASWSTARGASRRALDAPLRRAGRGHRRRHAALGAVAADRPDGDVERGRGRPRRTTSPSRATSRSRRCAAAAGHRPRVRWTTCARSPPRAASTRPSSRRSPRPRGADVRRHGRPRADLRGPPPADRRRQAARARRDRPRLRGPQALVRRPGRG